MTTSGSAVGRWGGRSSFGDYYSIIGLCPLPVVVHRAPPGIIATKMSACFHVSLSVIHVCDWSPQGTRPCRPFSHVGVQPLGKRPKAIGYMVFYLKGSLQLLSACVWVRAKAHRLQQMCGAKLVGAECRSLTVSKTEMALGCQQKSMS